jgi:hypothetical protein
VTPAPPPAARTQPTPAPAPTPVQPPAPRPAPEAPTNPLVEAKGFTALERITFEKGASGTDVLLWLDGAVNASRYVRSELGGASPRVLVRLKGVTRDFPGGKVAVGSNEVAQVRTGYHAEKGLNELHVVIDLTRSGIVVTRMEEEPRRLRIHLQRK